MPIGNPDSVPPGVFLKHYTQAREPNERLQRSIIKILGTEENYRRIIEPLKALSADQLAEKFVVSYNGLTVAALEVQLLKAMFKDEKSFRAALQRAINVVHTPEGIMSLPLAQALVVHRVQLRQSAKWRQELGDWPDLAGSYHATVRGECPFASGPVDVQQRDFVLEAFRGGKLLLIGAVGSLQAYFLANEQVYAAVTMSETQGISFHVPDRPPELYQVALDMDELLLTGRTYAACELDLVQRAGD